MALFRRDLKNRLSVEDANPRIVEAEAGASVARVGQLKKETDESLAEVVAVEAEGELLTEEMEVLADEYQGLDKVRATLESFRSEGGMHPQAAAVLQAALEGFRVRLGMNVAVPSSESFGSSTDRMAMTEISIESLSDTMAKIWKAIKDAWNKMVDWVKGLFGKKKETAEKLKERFKALKDADAPKGKPGKEAGMEFSKTKSILYKDKLIEGPSEAIKFITENANFGLSVLAMNKKLTEAVKEADKATTEAASAPAGSTASSEGYVPSLEAKGKKPKASEPKVAKAQEETVNAAKSAVEPLAQASGDKPSAPAPAIEGETSGETIVSPYFFGGQYVVFTKSADNADFAAEVKKPEKYEDKEGKLAFTSNWSEVKASAEACFKYLDDYTASKAAEETAAAMEKLAGKDIKTDNSEAQNFIRAVMQNYQKLIGDVLGKVDTAVLSGMTPAADYYEATKESSKEE